MDSAIEKYQEALEKDPFNEYAIANIGAIFMMRQDHEKSVEYCTRALDIIDHFQNETKSFSKQNLLEIKLLMRRQKSLNCLSEFEKCKEDLDRVLLLEPAHSEANQCLKLV